MRSRLPSQRRTRAVAEDMSKLFPQCKRMKQQKDKIHSSSWTHLFVCLSEKDQTTIPTTAAEKERLICAGLGEKKVVFDDIDCSAGEFRETLFTAFPKLKEGGGYQLCKCKRNSRELETLSSVSLTSPRALQSCGGKSRSYIRPLQKDLDISRVITTEEV